MDFAQVVRPVNITGTVPLPTGSATAANQVLEIAQLTSIDGHLANIDAGTPNALGQAVMAASMAVVIASDQSAIPITVAALPLPSGASTAALQTTGNTTAASILARMTAGTGTNTSVAQNPAQVTLLAANPNRKGFTLYNDASAKVFVSFSATASTTSYSTHISANAAYEPVQAVPYTGVITAIWNSGTTGFMRITEFT